MDGEELYIRALYGFAQSFAYGVQALSQRFWRRNTSFEAKCCSIVFRVALHFVGGIELRLPLNQQTDHGQHDIPFGYLWLTAFGQIPALIAILYELTTAEHVPDDAQTRRCYIPSAAIRYKLDCLPYGHGIASIYDSMIPYSQDDLSLSTAPIRCL